MWQVFKNSEMILKCSLAWKDVVWIVKFPRFYGPKNYLNNLKLFDPNMLSVPSTRLFLIQNNKNISFEGNCNLDGQINNAPTWKNKVSTTVKFLELLHI